jgi:hypothetical protein
MIPVTEPIKHSSEAGIDHSNAINKFHTLRETSNNEFQKLILYINF